MGLNTRVTEVLPDRLKLKPKNGDAIEIPSSMTLWSTGVTAPPLVKELQKASSEQTKVNGIETDRFLKAKGFSNVWAAGDCCNVAEGDSMQDEMMQLFLKADDDKSGTLDEKEVENVFSSAGRRFPQASVYSRNAMELFDEYDADGSKCISQEEFKEMLKAVDANLNSLPPTAQVAGQMGTYLAAQFNGEKDLPFKYFHKGSMAYLGQNKAAAQVSMIKNFLPEFVGKLVPAASEDIVLTGALAEVVWRFLYLDMLVSNRNKLQVIFDWVKAAAFGRDISRY